MELKLKNGDEMITIDVGSAEQANQWVQNIIDAQIASLWKNPTLYSGIL